MGAAKKGLGIGTAAAGGAASGAAFGPIGAGIGGLIGAGLGLWGALDNSEEEELKRKRDTAKKMALVEALRNRANTLGAPTDNLDMALKLKGIDEGYQANMDQLNRVGPQDVMGFAQSAAQLGGKVKDWSGVAKGSPQGPMIRNSDLYGTPDARTGLVQDEDGVLTDPMMRGRRAL